MKKLALHWKIVIGMVLGVVFALVVAPMEFGAEYSGTKFIDQWIAPFGTIFVNALKTHSRSTHPSFFDQRHLRLKGHCQIQKNGIENGSDLHCHNTYSH